MNQLKELLPDWYEGIKETNVLMDIEQDLIDQLALQIQQVQNNQYISTADSKTIGLYEQMLGITSNISDTLDLRRFRVLTRLTTQKPYTIRYLQEVLSSFGDPAELKMLYDEYRLLVEMNFEKLGQVSELEYLFRSIVPANILVEANNELKFNSASGQIYLGGALVLNEMVTITQDITENPTISTKAITSAGQAVAEIVETKERSDDFGI